MDLYGLLERSYAVASEHAKGMRVCHVEIQHPLEYRLHNELRFSAEATYSARSRLLESLKVTLEHDTPTPFTPEELIGVASYAAPPKAIVVHCIHPENDSWKYDIDLIMASPKWYSVAVLQRDPKSPYADTDMTGLVQCFGFEPRPGEMIKEGRLSLEDIPRAYEWCRRSGMNLRINVIGATGQEAAIMHGREESHGAYHQRFILKKEAAKRITQDDVAAMEKTLQDYRGFRITETPLSITEYIALMDKLEFPDPLTALKQGRTWESKLYNLASWLMRQRVMYSWTRDLPLLD